MALRLQTPSWLTIVHRLADGHATVSAGIGSLRVDEQGAEAMVVRIHAPVVFALLLERLVVVADRAGDAGPDLAPVENGGHLGAMVDAGQPGCGGQEVAHLEVLGVVGVLLAAGGETRTVGHRPARPRSGLSGSAGTQVEPDASRSRFSPARPSRPLPSLYCAEIRRGGVCVPQNVLMPVPQIGLLEAFAIGIPVGIAGFAVQEAIIRRRLARSPGERPQPRKTDFGPREEAQKDPGDGSQGAVDVTSPPPVPLTKPSRTRPKRAGATPAQVAVAISPAKALASASKEAATGVPAKAVAIAPKKAAVIKPAAPSKPAATPEPAAKPKPAAAPKAAAAPRPATVASKPAPVKGPPKPLLKREASLDAALEAVVDFVDGAPRRARPEACASELSRLLPKATREPTLVAFVAAIASGTAPGELQILAESVGVKLAGELQAVRREISSLNY